MKASLEGQYLAKEWLWQRRRTSGGVACLSGSQVSVGELWFSGAPRTRRFALHLATGDCIFYTNETQTELRLMFRRFSLGRELKYSTHGRIRSRVIMKKLSAALVAEPKEQTRTRSRRSPKKKRQPKYNVILWDDNDHTYEYVIHLLTDIFGYAKEKGFQIAETVDNSGKAICLTTTREHAELKRDQIHAFGKDDRLARCAGSMWATIEPVE